MYDPKHEASYKKARRAARQAERRAGGVAADTAQATGVLGGPCERPGGLDYPSLDDALRRYPGSYVRVLHSVGGDIWYKLALRAAPWPKHYLIVSAPEALPIASGLLRLEDKAGAFLAGHVKPSPD